MNILNKIAIQNLKLNKKRTISTIIGIILSCSLIMAVSTMITSFRETLVQNAINETGYYHLKIDEVTDEKIRTLKNNRDIKNVYTVDQYGYGILENSQNEYKPYLKLVSMKKTIFENLRFKLIEGRFPLNSNEVIISKHIKTNAQVDLKIGETINIDIGNRKGLDGLKLKGNNPYQDTGETIENTKNYEFTIVRNYRKT